MGVLKALDRALGDKSVSWDKGKPEQVEAAKQEFEYLVKEKRYKAYRIDPSKPGRKGVPVAAFDPAAEELLLVPQMQGG
jgi:hypothetical protein